MCSNLLKLKKFIYSASASCYGNPKKIPTSEKEKIKILSPYALTKWKSEKEIMKYAKIYKFPAISLRLFNVYGPRFSSTGPYSSVISIFLKQKNNNKPLTIVGDGLQTRSFIYISDVINSMMKAVRSKISNEIFNVGYENLKVIEIAELVRKTINKNVDLKVLPTDDNRSYHISSGKIEEKLGFKMNNTVEDAIKDLISAFDQNKFDEPLVNENYFNIKKMQNIKLS